LTGSRGSAPGLPSAGDLLNEASQALAAAGIENPRREARLLLAHAAGIDQATLLRDRDHPLAAPGFAALVQRRVAREPLALITGRQGFWSLEFEVSADTLIPRADSEAVIEAALAACAGQSVRRVLDLGTGTGCLLLAALAEFPQAWGVGIDRAEGAARLARRNAESLGLAGRAAFLCGDWAAALEARFDLVLSNPPYIVANEIAGLMPEVALYEPRRALDGGADGLDAYRSILAALPALLEPGGVAVLELGAGQSEPVVALARAEGLVPASLHHDLSGTKRALVVGLDPGKKPFGRPGAPG
jgi:release factor glutamine methyltransferase